MPGTNPIPIEFTASATNKLVCGLGAVDVSTGLTLAAVFKPKASAAYRNGMSIADSGGTDLCSFEINTSDTPVLVINNGEIVTVVNPLVDNEWYMFVVTKPSGNSVPRGHVYRFSTTSFVERANGAASIDPTGTENQIILGEWQDTDPSNFYAATWAVWNTNLSDGQIDTMPANFDAWQALAPDWWVIANGATPMIDETGGTGDETSREASVAAAPGETSPLQWAVVPSTGREYKRFFGPALLANAAADLYTVPSGKRSRVLNIHASNPTASPVDLTLSIGADAAATRVYDDFRVSADSIESNFDPYDMAAGEKIQGLADTNAVMNLTITGYEESA